MGMEVCWERRSSRCSKRCMTRRRRSFMVFTDWISGVGGDGSWKEEVSLDSSWSLCWWQKPLRPGPTLT